jgi:hypothetical protein
VVPRAEKVVELLKMALKLAAEDDSGTTRRKTP